MRGTSARGLYFCGERTKVPAQAKLGRGTLGSLGRLPPIFMFQTLKIITSVALMRAAAVCPGFKCISLAERAVMIDVIC